MSARVRWGAGLLLVAAGFVSQGCEIPSAEPGKTQLTLSLTQGGPIIIHANNTLELDVQDQDGRVLVDPPTVWSFTDEKGKPSNLVAVVQAEGRDAVVVGQHPGTVNVSVQIPESNPWFTTDALTTQMTVGYSPVTVSFEGVGSDTVLTARGLFQLTAHAVDEQGGYVTDGSYEVTTGGHSVASERTSGTILYMNAFGFGPDTLVVTNTACPNPCADTLAVDVAPVAGGMDFGGATTSWSSVGDSVQLQVNVRDAAGYDIPNPPLTWRLVDPADSAVVQIIDPSTGAAVTRGNGTAEVTVTSGPVVAQTLLIVDQQTKEIQLWVPPHVVGVGTSFTASFVAYDANGTLIPPSYPVGAQWTADSSVLVASAYHDRDVVYVTQAYDSSDVQVAMNTCPDVCIWLHEARRVRVVPEPDSVVAYPQDGSTTMGAIGSTATWLGDIYLPGETISGVPLFWSSLDPAVATIDEDGTVTAVSVGTARIVGTMGAAADTAVVTVTG